MGCFERLGSLKRHFARLRPGRDQDRSKSLDLTIVRFKLS